MWASETVTFVGIDSGGSPSLGKVLTSSASIHTKGSYTELEDSTPVRADGLLICLGVSTIHDFLIDIAIGAAASEQIIVPNLHLTGRQAPRVISEVRLPLSIPAGTRVAARCQAGTVGAQAMRMSLGLITNGPPGFKRVTDYGTNTGDSGGQGIDPGASVNTKGSYAQIAASTSRDIRALVIGVCNGNNPNRADASWLLDLAIGGAGSEQIVLADLPIASDLDTGYVQPQYYGPFYTNIPSGTRLAARSQCDINDATDRLFDVIIYGLD